jgi:adenine-specific DNA methylase
MNNYPKRLIEVDLAIARISADARQERSIRHGHIPTLRMWRGRPALASCRPVSLATVLPGQADEACSKGFRIQDRLDWKPIVNVEHYACGSSSILAAEEGSA